jgi:hypothetical protein
MTDAAIKRVARHLAWRDGESPDRIVITNARVVVAGQAYKPGAGVPQWFHHVAEARTIVSMLDGVLG